MNARNISWKGSLTDAYAHIGNPKYGTLENVGVFLECLQIEGCVLVLGPGLPDLASLKMARESYGTRIRCMGIPFGETEAQRRELGEMQIDMGISGMRVMPSEFQSNKVLMDRLGEKGLWLFAIHPQESSQSIRFLLTWLECHPDGRIASPHFLSPTAMKKSVKDPGLFKELLRHPRFYGIFSRQGGVGSTQPYPHHDLLPWVTDLAEEMTFDRLMWGSEFPILYQRNEQPEDARDWILNLNIVLSPQEQEAFYHGNAARCFFGEEPNTANNHLMIPQWVEGQVDQKSKVYVFPNSPMHIPMAEYNALLTDYLNILRVRPELPFDEYIVERLCKGIST